MHSCTVEMVPFATYFTLDPCLVFILITVHLLAFYAYTFLFICSCSFFFLDCLLFFICFSSFSISLFLLRSAFLCSFFLLHSSFCLSQLGFFPSFLSPFSSSLLSHVRVHSSIFLLYFFAFLSSKNCITCSLEMCLGSAMVPGLKAGFSWFTSGTTECP